jgi:hypothetical protein
MSVLIDIGESMGRDALSAELHPVFGIIKSVMGYRQCLLRGLFRNRHPVRDIQSLLALREPQLLDTHNISQFTQS